MARAGNAGDVAAARPLRIAAHISAAEWGGAERRSLVLLAGLAGRGHDVVVYCGTRRIYDRIREHGLAAVLRPLSGDVMVGHAFAFAAHLRRQQPDVLLLITFRRLWLGALAGRLAGVPRIIARIGLATDVARSMKYRLVLKHWVDDVVVNAHALHAPFAAKLAPRSRARVHTIPNGVEPRAGELSRTDARRALDVPEHAFVVGTVTRIVKQKRIDRMLHAVAAAPESFAIIAGDGALLPAMKTLAAQLGIAERVRFPGYREDVGNVLAALDAYLIASDQEGMSSGMLEALAAGVPVISTAVSGADEALRGEPACGVVVGFDADAIAAAVTGLRDRPALRAQLAAAALEVARARYGTAAMVDAWDALLRA
ncbi:MAG: glycosyltransferase [Gemmatimonadota bacterium]